MRRIKDGLIYAGCVWVCCSDELRFVWRGQLRMRTNIVGVRSLTIHAVWVFCWTGNTCYSIHVSAYRLWLGFPVCA